MFQDSLLRITSHPRKGGFPSLLIVGALHNRRERMASGAAEQLVLLRLCSRNAEQPLGTGELRNEVFSFPQLQIRAMRRAGRHISGQRTRKVIPDGPYINVVLSR